LAERYVPGADRQLAVADAGRARQAGRELAAEGINVRYLSSALVPADETCFALFEACSADQVRQLLDRAALPYHHIVETILIAAEDP
jgi:phosphohistidine phosphatase SixA